MYYIFKTYLYMSDVEWRYSLFTRYRHTGWYRPFDHFTPIIYWVKHHTLCAISDSHGDHMVGQGVMSDGDDRDRKPMLQHQLYHPDQMHHTKVHHHHVMQDDHHQDFGIPLPPTNSKIWSETPAPPRHQWPKVISPSLALLGFTPCPTPHRCRRLGRLTPGKLELHII